LFLYNSEWLRELADAAISELAELAVPTMALLTFDKTFSALVELREA